MVRDHFIRNIVARILSDLRQMMKTNLVTKIPTRRTKTTKTTSSKTKISYLSSVMTRTRIIPLRMKLNMTVTKICPHDADIGQTAFSSSSKNSGI